MTYGAHAYLWRDELDTDALLALLDRAAALGLGFLEIPLGDDMGFDAARIGEAARQRQLQLVVSPGGLWPAMYDISLADETNRRRGIAWHRRMIGIGGECGAIAYTGAIYGRPGTVERGAWLAEDEERVAAGLAELAAAAEAAAMALVIEPMSHFRSHVCNTSAQAMRLISLAGNPSNLQLLADTYHLCTEITSYGAALHECLPKLWGLHACENTRGVPGTGLLPWPEIAAALDRWDGYVGFESYNSTWRDGRFARSRGMFHHVCPDGDAFVREALAFMRTAFAGRSV